MTFVCRRLRCAELRSYGCPWRLLPDQLLARAEHRNRRRTSCSPNCPRRIAGSRSEGRHRNRRRTSCRLDSPTRMPCSASDRIVRSSEGKAQWPPRSTGRIPGDAGPTGVPGDLQTKRLTDQLRSARRAGSARGHRRCRSKRPAGFLRSRTFPSDWRRCRL